MGRSRGIFVGGALGLLVVGGVAHAEPFVPSFIAEGRPVIDLRARYEDVDDASKAVIGQAGTLRARLGYETGTWNGFQLAADFDQVWVIGGATYNSTRNGKTAYPI